MMSSMGVPPPKELYPSLMSLPDLPLEQRAEVQEQAHERMKDGAALLSSALERLSRAAPGDDFTAMQDALGEVREGLARFESGLAAHRALAEGSAPRNVALQWFKREMNLLPLPAGAVTSGPFGIAWSHFFSMVVLVGFAGAMIWMYFHKMRRAAALVEALASSGNAASGLSPRAAMPAPPPQLDTSAAPAAPAGGTGAASPGDGPSDADCCASQEESCPSDLEAGTQGESTGLLPIRKKQLCRLRVAHTEEEVPGVRTFRFVACHGGGIPFSYLPGQFLTLTLPVGEKPIRRSYTISSSPTQGYYCEITVKREEHGAGSGYLHDRVKVGDTIEVQAPSGKFVFTGTEADSVVLIAGGVGITPMMSITRAMTDMAWEGDIYFIVACRDPEHFIFEEELRRLRARHPNLYVFAAMSRLDQDLDGYRKGRLSPELLAEWVPEIASRRIHVCGPPAMMDAVKAMLAELDVPQDNLHTESFGGGQKPRVRAAEVAEKAATGVVEPAGTVTFSRSGKSAARLPDETILEAAERVDVDIEYSCRVGSCGVCTVKLLSGQVSMEVEDGLEPEDKEAGMVLACQAKSTGDVSVDA